MFINEAPFLLNFYTLHLSGPLGEKERDLLIAYFIVSIWFYIQAVRIAFFRSNCAVGRFYLHFFIKEPYVSF